MAKTVIGLMDDIGEAQAVVRQLVEAGVRREDIGFMANQKHAVPSSAARRRRRGVMLANLSLEGRPRDISRSRWWEVRWSLPGCQT